MSAVRDGFNAIFGDSTGDASDLAHRALHLIRATQNKLSEFERRGVLSAADVVLGRLNRKLGEIPLAELDATATKLEKHIAKHGCCVVQCSREDYRLSDVLLQLRSTQEQLQPYLPHWPK